MTNISVQCTHVSSLQNSKFVTVVKIKTYGQLQPGALLVGIWMSTVWISTFLFDTVLAADMSLSNFVLWSCKLQFPGGSHVVCHHFILFMPQFQHHVSSKTYPKRISQLTICVCYPLRKRILQGLMIGGHCTNSTGGTVDELQEVEMNIEGLKQEILHKEHKT